MELSERRMKEREISEKRERERAEQTEAWMKKRAEPAEVVVAKERGSKARKKDGETGEDEEVLQGYADGDGDGDESTASKAKRRRQ